MTEYDKGYEEIHGLFCWYNSIPDFRYKCGENVKIFVFFFFFDMLLI